MLRRIVFRLAWTAIVSRDIVGPAILLECRAVSCSTDRAKFFRYILWLDVSCTVVRYNSHTYSVFDEYTRRRLLSATRFRHASNSNIEILQRFQSYMATWRYPQLKKKYRNSVTDIILGHPISSCRLFCIHFTYISIYKHTAISDQCTWKMGRSCTTRGGLHFFMKLKGM